MSDNEDLLADDLGDQSLADYNLGNDEEDQLLADDYENTGTQNVPSAHGSAYGGTIDNMVPQPPEYTAQEYGNQSLSYQHPQPLETECVVPNIPVEVTISATEHASYVPLETPPVYEEHAVPPAIPAAPVESPQIVPSDILPPMSNGTANICDMGPRVQFIPEQPAEAPRMPLVRNIPDSLDKVVIPRGGMTWSRGTGRTWQSSKYVARHATHGLRPGQGTQGMHTYSNVYRRNNMHRNNFHQRAPLPPLQIRPNQQQIRNIRPEIRPQIQSNLRAEVPRPEIRPNIPMELNITTQMGPEISPERPILPQEIPMFRPSAERPQYFSRYQYRPNMEERSQFGPRPFGDQRFFRPNFPSRHFAPAIREMPPNGPQLQVTTREPLPGMSAPGLDTIGLKGDLPRETDVRMMPVIPPSMASASLAGKKVLINPHFKGNFQPPADGPVKDIDDAAERFIAEQRNALARAAVRKQARRSPQRYIENTTIEVENEFAHMPYNRNNEDEDLFRRQEEFINANRAGLRRRMRTPSPPPRRSPSPRRSPEDRPRLEDDRHDEDSEYKRRLREQENLRERVLRAKEVRRRKNAVALHKQLQEKDREIQEKPAPKMCPETTDKPSNADQEVGPEATKTSPDREKEKQTDAPAVRDRSPLRESVQANSTIENLTPPHKQKQAVLKVQSPERALTPPLPEKKEDKAVDSDDDLDLILGDIDGILSDDEDSGRFKEKVKRTTQQHKSKPLVDLRSKLPPKSNSTGDKKPQRQKIIFEDKDIKNKKDKSPPVRALTTNTVKMEDTENATANTSSKEETDNDDNKSVSNRRVIQRKITKEKATLSRIDVKGDPTQPNPGIFSRAVRTAIGGDNNRVVVKKEEPQIEYESDSEIDEEAAMSESSDITAIVLNLPHGMTDTRIRTLAGNDVQNLILDKEERTAKITFKTSIAAENFKKKFNNKMVAASRLTVTLR